MHPNRRDVLAGQFTAEVAGDIVGVEEAGGQEQRARRACT